MTLDEAIMHCMDIAETQEMCSNGKKCAKEHRQLAEWLKELKALREQEPCEDAISRQAVVDWLTDRTEKYDEKGHFISKELVKAEVKKWLAELPSVTPVNVYVKGYKDAMEIHEKLKVEHKGKWMVVEHNCGYVRCSICNKRVPFCKRSNYCPNCGAKMAERSGEDADSD